MWLGYRPRVFVIEPSSLQHRSQPVRTQHPKEEAVNYMLIQYQEHHTGVREGRCMRAPGQYRSWPVVEVREREGSGQRKPRNADSHAGIRG